VLGLSQNGSTYYTRDTDGQPLAERTSSRHYLLPDGLGSTRALTDSAGNVLSRYEYEPYGAEEAPAPSGTTTKLRYTGAEFSTSLSLYKLGMRWYDPINQRWTQQDVIEGPADPRHVNRYVYAAADPVNRLDPMGSISILGAAKGVP
jgi:RHS repeat-associated protein